MTELAMLLDPSVMAVYPALTEIERLLDELASLIQQVEARLARTPSGNLRSLIEANAPATRSLMDALGGAILDFIDAGPPPDVVQCISAAISGRLRAWSNASPLFYHIFNTPRHKFGPYEVFDLLLKNRSGGADVAGQMLDHYYMNTVTAASFRLRNESLTHRLAAEIKLRSREYRPVRLLNLHTGSGPELQTLLQERYLQARLQVTCLDTDASAIRRVKQQLSGHLARDITFQFGDPRKIVQSPTWPDAPYDLIYALVLFDQLSDDQAGSLIAGCYRGLRPGGTLILGNYAMSMPDQEHILIHWVLNLNIRRRSETTLRSIFAHTPFGARFLACELDALGVSWLVSAKRE